MEEEVSPVRSEEMEKHKQIKRGKWDVRRHQQVERNVKVHLVWKFRGLYFKYLGLVNQERCKGVSLEYLEYTA